MGIPGLTTFITGENQHLLEDFRLHDTSLLIDGDNVLHFLYHRLQVSCHFGGDYDTFKVECTLFFDQLAECNIRPFVVLDGAYDTNGRKLRTIMRRAEARFQKIVELLRGEQDPVLPIFARDTFIAVLKTRGIPHITYEFEADVQIAALAIKRNWPVLTNDSDFLIFSIPEGIVHLDYVKLTVERENNEGNYNYMQVKKYHVAGLMSKLSTDDGKIVALFATVLGNDATSGSTFSPFIMDLFKNNGKSSESRKRQEIIEALIKWFQVKRNFTYAKRLAHVLSFIQPEERDTVERTIDANIKWYTDLECALTIADDDQFEYSARRSVNSFSGKPLPHWYLVQIEKSEMPVSTLNVLTLRRRVLHCQVEKMNSPSSHVCSGRLRRFMYTVLLSVDAVDDSSEMAKQDLCVDEYDRKYKTLECNKVRPLESLHDGRQVPRLEDIPDLDECERQNVLLDVLQVQRDDLMTYPSGVQLLIATMAFWVKNASPRVGILHLEALLVCCVKLGILREALESENSTTRLEQCNRQYTVGFEEEIIHAFSQFQSCLQASIDANKLLLLPFPPLDPARIFNGTFICNFYRKLLGKKKPEAYVDKLMGKSTSTATAFAKLRTAVRRLSTGADAADVVAEEEEELKINWSL